jgi:hypothetical protein
MSRDTPSNYWLVLENSTNEPQSWQSYWFSHKAEDKPVSYGGGTNLGPNQQSSRIQTSVIGGQDDYWTVSFVNSSGDLYSTGLLVKANVASGLPEGTIITLDVVPAANNQFQVNIEYPGYKAGPLTLSLFGQPTAD